METLLQQLLGILVNPPGNMIYHLVLAFSVFAALQTALINRRTSVESGRLLLGLNLILIAQLALFLTSGLSWQQVIIGHLFLPVFDRAVIAFTLLWLGWLWAFPTRHRVADIAMVVLNLGIIALFIYTYTQWNRTGASLDFNNTNEDWIWCFSGVGILVVSMVAVLVRRPEGWAIGFGMALLNLAGLLAHIFLPTGGGDYGGYIRLAQLAAFPLLPGLLTRLGASPEIAPLVSTAKNETATSLSRGAPRIVDPRAVHAWINLNLQQEPAQICTGIAHAVAQSLLADLCFVATTPADPHSPVIFQGGYDLLREEEVPGTLLDQSQIPTLTAALVKGRSIRLIAADQHSSDLKSIADALGLKEAGNILLLPLTQNNRPWGGLVLLSPYSNRSWTSEDQNYLASEAESIASILSRAQTQHEKRQENERLKDILNDIGQEAEDLRQRNQGLLKEMSALRAGPSAGASQPDIEALLAVQKETQEALSAVQAENIRLNALVPRRNGQPPDGADVNQFEIELRAVLQEIARLQNQLARANSRVVELERQNGKGTPLDIQAGETLASAAQELRQPMSAIMGYTDLLLSESIGILGKAQKKFLEHIRASSERLRSLIDDLIQITSKDQLRSEYFQPVDLFEVIDGALTELRPQLLERSIQIDVDLAEDMPAVFADRDTLQQIAAHLLRNAGSVSPLDGSIRLHTSLKRDENSDYIVLQITDSGGGIPAEDLPRVFMHRLPPDASPIQGVSDGGTGLAIVKTLVDSIGGRIWVESEPDRSSTYSVLLPTHPASAREKI